MQTTQGYEVLYASNEDSFRTVQTHYPVPGRFYMPVEIHAVILEGVGPWAVDGSDPNVPKAVNGKGGSKPLNRAIREGLIRVSAPSNYQQAPNQKQA